ncbi:MAG TPA: response regulator [Bacillaceae bacterium]
MIRIVIAEDHEMLLGVIGSLLDLEDDMEVVGQARNGEEAIALVHQFKPDVCIVDIEMSGLGLDVVEAFMPPECKVILLATFAREGYIERARNAGVCGYLLKDSPSEELACSIRSINSGRQVFSPELADDVAEKEDDATWDLNENDVMKRKAVGTVRHYLASIMEKVKMRTG